MCEELLNEEIFDTLDDARREMSLWRNDYNNFRPHSTLGNQHQQKRVGRLSILTGPVHDTLAQTQRQIMESKPANSRYQ
jgi:putative transposase